MTQLLNADDLSVTFNARRPWLSTRLPTPAVKSVSLSVQRGETLGIVGESGCGKSTLGRALLGLVPLTSGTVSYRGTKFTDRTVPLDVRRNLQLVHQDPYASFDPLHTVRFSVGEPLRIHREKFTRTEIDTRVREQVTATGIDADSLDRYPHEFSGGQLQRLAIARALLVRPEIVLLDESVSALDVSIRARVLRLLDELKAEQSLTYLFISHDLGVIEHSATRVAVMYLGRVIEIAPTQQLFAAPRHPYTRALLSAVPVPDPRKERARERIILDGDVPNARTEISGCEFRPRCPLYRSLGRPELCESARPVLMPDSPDHGVACHFSAESLAMPSLA